jgi:hypothetical protein
MKVVAEPAEPPPPSVPPSEPPVPAFDVPPAAPVPLVDAPLVDAPLVDAPLLVGLPLAPPVPPLVEPPIEDEPPRLLSSEPPSQPEAPHAARYNTPPSQLRRSELALFILERPDALRTEGSTPVALAPRRRGDRLERDAREEGIYGTANYPTMRR